MSETQSLKEKPARQSLALQAPAGGEYELSYFLTTDISENSVDSAISELNLLITDSGGENTGLETPKIRRLSYPIKKQNEAYFGVVYFNINTEGLLKIKKSLALNKKFLRHIILNKPLKPKPAAASLAPNVLISPLTQSFDEKLENILNRQ